MIVLVVDDEAPARYGLVKALRCDGRTILEADNGDAAIQCVRARHPDLMFLDLNMPNKNGMDVLRELNQTLESLPEIIVVTANESLDHAIQCIRLGATDYLTKPYDVHHVRSIADRVHQRVKLEAEVERLKTEMNRITSSSTLIGVSRAMRSLDEKINRAAMTTLPVLIRGESGTGKELVARELHARGDRKKRPFVAVNTAAIPASLIESELFGHVKGAFTGADRDRTGVFRGADGGTLFLDEIGDMPASVQTRLLRVLQEQVVQPVGTEESIRVDVRVISATHQDLEEAIENKTFRQDLYYRLRGIELTLPPLRHRPDDLLMLANAFAISVSTGDREIVFAHDTVSAMIQYGWPGNVRELKQRVESAVAMSTHDQLTCQDLGLSICNDVVPSQAFDEYLSLPLTEARDRLVADYERLAIERALIAHDQNISAAARALGIHRQSLQQKITKLSGA